VPQMEEKEEKTASQPCASTTLRWRQRSVQLGSQRRDSVRVCMETENGRVPTDHYAAYHNMVMPVK